MNKSFRFLLASASLVFAVACEKDNRPVKTTSTDATNVSPPADSAQARGHSLVHVVDAVNGGKNVAAELDGQSLFADVKSGSVTDYREIANDLAKFSIRVPGAVDGMMLAQKDHLLLDGNRYTVFVIAADVSKNSLRIVKDDVISDSGKARLRVVHAAPGAPEMDVSIAGAKDKLFAGVNFRSEAGYKDVVPATVTLELRAKNEAKVLLRIPRVELKRRTATTIVVTGASKLNYFKFTDSLMAPTPRP